jgi:hypothetical protein
MAPRTSGSGALSEPIASTTMSIGISLRALWDQYSVVVLASFFDRKNVAALVGATLAAGAVRKLALVAVRALREAGRCQKIVAAALGSPLLGVAPFWIRHCCIPLNLLNQNRLNSISSVQFRPLLHQLIFQACKRIPSRIG